MLAVDPAHTRVLCNGTAERSYLKPGVLVKFEGEFDRKMQPKGGPLDTQRFPWSAPRTLPSRASIPIRPRATKEERRKTPRETRRQRELRRYRHDQAL